MFLTTNRVGVLDDAIKSRITWIAYYPPLDEQQTKKIWKVNIKLLEERNKRLQVDRKGILRFAKEHFTSSATRDSTWNGRQIQNAFKVATALAEWDAYSKDVQHNINTRVPEEHMSGQPKLLASHFNTIAAGTQAFSSYLQEATGYTEAERAFNAMERVDNYTVEDHAHDSVSIATQRDYDRSQLPLPSSSSLSSRQRRSSSITVASPHSFSGDYSPPPHLQTSRRTSSQGHHRASHPSPGQNPNSVPPPKSQSRKSHGQHTAAAVPMDSQLQSPQANRISYSASLSQTIAAAAATTSSPSSSSLNTKKNSKHRSSTSSALVARQESEGDDDDPGNWDGSSENEGEDREELRDAAPNEGTDDEEW